MAPDAERRPHPGFRSPSWAWALALIAIVMIALLSLTLLRRGTGHAARGLPPGSMIPPFAAPLVDSPVDGDVNLARRADSGSAGRVAACDVRMRGVLTSCALTARAPLVLGFSTFGGRCLRELDGLERLHRAEGGRITVAAVAVRGDRDRWRELARGRWSFPLLYDRDGGLTTAYGVELCPLTMFVERGGRVRSVAIGQLDDAALRARVRALHSMELR